LNTKLLELTVYINRKKLEIVNTNIDVNIEWDVDLEKKLDSAILTYSFEQVYGSFKVNHITEDLYTKESTYKFTATNKRWLFSHVPFQTDNISPTGIIINFDEKTINIKF